MVRDSSCSVDIHHVFIDLDNTLYVNNEVEVAMKAKIHHYMTKDLRMSEIEATQAREDYYLKYGTSLSGLVAEGYDVDISLYQELIHDLEYDKLVFPDPELKAMLMQISQPMYIFTNGTESHAMRCLKRLEMEDIFQGIISFDSLQTSAANAGIELNQYIVCKPDLQAYKLALHKIGGEAEKTLFVDDSSRNIHAAKELNMPTLLIKQGLEVNVSDRVAPSLIHMPKIYPSLFNNSTRECSNCESNT
eukprot:g3141.t1